MALSLPQYFAEDIQKRDTSLVPIVVFGNYDPNGTDWLSSVYRISTNNITYAGQYYRPLLLNIPSIKESIDYKSKKHKISSITLSVSNLIHNNERFSEWIDSNIMNMECRIFWITPRSKNLRFYDLGVDYNEESAFQIFYGKVRRYSHDNKNVSIQIEDQSQEKLHKDLPLTDNWLGDQEDVPGKYKGKPVPMVYGEVNGSPCVIKSAPKVVDDEYSSETTLQSGEVLIVADNNETITYEGDTPLKLFKSDQYIPVIREHGNVFWLKDDTGAGNDPTPFDLSSNSSPQYEINSNDIILTSKHNAQGSEFEDEFSVSSPIAGNKIAAKSIISPSSIDPLRMESSVGGDGTSNDSIKHYYTTVKYDRNNHQYQREGEGIIGTLFS